MIRLPPVTRISIGLVLLTVSILLGGDLLGLIPKRSKVVLDERMRLCESLAMQFSVAAQKGDKATIESVLSGLVERNEALLSAGVRQADGTLMVKAGDHGRNWKAAPQENSSPTHVRVPIVKGGRLWGTLETSFRPLEGSGILGPWGGNLFTLVVFFMLSGFVVYRFFMKKTLRQLDPSSVIPPRVKKTLDQLVEGIVLMDGKEHIVLTNKAFEEQMGLPASSMLGRKLSEMNWSVPEGEEHLEDFSWQQALREKQNRNNVRMFLTTASDVRRTFMVNVSPILDGGGKCRGVLASFDDVTLVEEQNEQLQKMLVELEKSRDEVSKQNKKLEILASRDPLTGCLNRRAFFERIDEYVLEAEQEGQELSCIMVDIDHFKSINDKYGHVTGDKVLKEVADALRKPLGENDLLCRYGGEEFCIVLPQVGLSEAVETAERLRGNVEFIKHLGIPTTASFGVASWESADDNMSEVLQEADKALYAAKNGGRNQVISWEQMNAEADSTRSEAVG
jgi:diguanylate cyclase (GGDEF)-like protein/PAS domain S-box-containing protein